MRTVAELRELAETQRRAQSLAMYEEMVWNVLSGSQKEEPVLKIMPLPGNRESMSAPFHVDAATPHSPEWFERMQRQAVIDGRVEALRQQEAEQVKRESNIPPGYRLTAEAEARIHQLDTCGNRRRRRTLLAHFRKHPITTFERIPT